MSLSSYTHDFGIISSDIICRDSIIITNVGNARLEIGEIETGCGCTQASVEKYELNPDESCSLHFSFKKKLSQTILRTKLGTGTRIFPHQNQFTPHHTQA